MSDPKHNGNEPEEYRPGDTLVVDDDAVMETNEFRKLVSLDPDFVDDIEPPDTDEQIIVPDRDSRHGTRRALLLFFDAEGVPDAHMLKFKLTAGRKNRLDDAEQVVETTRIDEMTAAEFREILDDSPTDEMEVIRIRKDDQRLCNSVPPPLALNYSLPRYGGAFFVVAPDSMAILTKKRNGGEK